MFSFPFEAWTLDTKHININSRPVKGQEMAQQSQEGRMETTGTVTIHL